MARKKKPIKLITLDTETYKGLIGGLKRIAIYDGAKVTYGYTFFDVEKVLMGFFIDGFDVHVYIHNLEFDSRKISEVFHQDIIMWDKCMLINNKYAKITTKYYTLHDSMKILPMSLRKLSESFEVENGKLDLLDEVRKDYGTQYDIYDEQGRLDDNKSLVNFLDKCDIDDELLLKYLGYDVISLYEVLEKFRDLLGFDLQTFITRLSTASISRYILKNGYKGKEFIHKDSNKTDYEMLTSFKWYGGKIDGYNWEDVEEWLRESYVGGRTEVFKPRLEEQGYHYDYNSLYPSQFHKEYPIGKPRVESGEYAENEWENWLQFKRGLGFIKAKVYIPYQHIPPLPVRMGKLVFPCGEVIGTWTYNELEYAIKNCGVEIREIFITIHFQKTWKVFDTFVEVFYTMKEEADRDKKEALRTLAKLLLNVAYGYTGMRRDDKTALQPISKLEKYDEDQIINIEEEMGFIEVSSEIKSDYIQVQVASYVTSYARLMLLDAMRKAHKDGIEVYYCDTDSIVTNKPLPKEIVDDRKLGYLKLETMPDRAIFLRPKVYAESYGNKTTKKFKGVSRETIQKDFEFETYEFLYQELEEMKHDAVIVEKNRTMLNSLVVLQKKNLPYDYYEVRNKKMNLKTTEKREMFYKENYTKPLYFEKIADFHDYEFYTKPSHLEIDLTSPRKK